MATGKLQITTRGDRELVMIRSFDAPRNLVFETLTKAELIRKWLLGPPGWTMPVCEIDLRVGGSYRYLWRHAEGHEMGMGGIYREIAPPERLVATEKFDQAWYPGGAIVSFALTEQAGKTTLTQTVQYDSAEALQTVLKSPMEGGVTAGYDRLEELLTSMTAASAERGAR